MRKTLNIADICFAVPDECCTEPINAYFKQFWSEETASGQLCKITSFTPDERLAALSLNPDAGWSFAIKAERFVVQRRNEVGAVLWQYELSFDFEHVCVSYAPKLFFDHYFSIEDLLCRDLGLSLLVLGLHSRGGLLIHGSASVLDQEAVLCVGPKGAGKTTIATFLSTNGATVLSDEHPVVRQWPVPGEEFSSPDFRVYGSPWPSSGGYVSNEWAPLKRIYFLKHGLENTLTPLSPAEAAALFMQVVTVPSWQHPELFDPCLQTVETLLATVPAAVLSFRPDEEVIDVIRQDLAAERVCA